MTKGVDIEKAYALIIGISEYKDPNIRRLKYTHADAEGIFKLLIDPKRLGLSKDKIKILLDKDATRFNIKNAITSWLKKNADKDSVVIIFFAGHGHAEEDPTGIEKDNLIKYLLPYDTVIEDIYNSAISNRDFHELLLTIKSKKLVIFMDSCYSGGVSGASRGEITMITDDPYEKLAEGEGRIVIAASQPNQRSFENVELEHGIFTYNLLEALSGKADWDNDGYVTVLDAWKYLENTVPRDAKKLAGCEQDPILRGDITKDFVISIDREQFEKIEKQKVLEEKLGLLDTFYDEGKFSGKQYDYLRALLKIDPKELKDKNKKIVKRINDFLSGNISITTFFENMEGLEPELFGISEKKSQEHEQLQRQKEERRDVELREKVDKEAKLNAQKEAQQLEQKRRERDRLIVYAKYFFGVAVLLGILALGWWALSHGSNNVPAPSPIVVPTAYPTPIPIVVSTAYPTPIITFIPTPTITITPMPITLPENKTSLVVGETWDLSGGWRLTVNSINVKSSPRQVWLTLYDQYGTKLDDKVVYQGEKYSYGWFGIRINAIFAGATSDVVEFTDPSIYLSTGDTLNVGDGWRLTVSAIDVKSSPRQVWLTLYDQYGTKLEDKVVSLGDIYSHNNIPIIKIEAIFAGATTDMLEISY